MSTSAVNNDVKNQSACAQLLKLIGGKKRSNYTLRVLTLAFNADVNGQWFAFLGLFEVFDF